MQNVIFSELYSIKVCVVYLVDTLTSITFQLLNGKCLHPFHQFVICKCNVVNCVSILMYAHTAIHAAKDVLQL